MKNKRRICLVETNNYRSFILRYTDIPVHNCYHRYLKHRCEILGKFGMISWKFNRIGQCVYNRSWCIQAWSRNESWFSERGNLSITNPAESDAGAEMNVGPAVARTPKRRNLSLAVPAGSETGAEMKVGLLENP